MGGYSEKKKKPSEMKYWTKKISEKSLPILLLLLKQIWMKFQWFRHT